MDINTMIRDVQRALGVTVDGRAGPQTWGAIHAALVQRRNAARAESPTVSPVDPRSEQNIASLLPEVRPLARALVQKAAASEIEIRVISGTRSIEEQDALYAQGRTTPGPKVTNARGGYSNHNFGIAFDVGVFSGARYLAASSKYKAVGALGMDLGLEWGGNWTSIRDEPHFQLRPTWASGLRERDMLAQLRSRVEEGRPVLA